MTQIIHSKVAQELQNFVLMRKSDDYAKLYRPDMERFMFLELYFGKSESWKVNLVTKHKETFLKEKIQKKFSHRKIQSFR